MKLKLCKMWISSLILVLVATSGLVRGCFNYSKCDFELRRCYCVLFWATYLEGREICAKKGGSLLMMPKSEEQMDVISKVLPIANDVYHIGLNDMENEGVYEWENGAPLNNNSYTNFDDTQVNVEDRDCAGMQNGKWYTYPCSQPTNIVICEVTIDCGGDNAQWIGDECIKFYDEPKSWADAQADCSKKPGGKLTSLTSEEITEHVRGEAKNRKKLIWLGATDTVQEGTWVWSSTGEVANIEPSLWGRGQPDDWLGNEDCLQVRADQTLNDLDCGKKYPYFCTISYTKWLQ